MGTDLAGQHRGCEERLLESLPPERSKKPRRVWLIMPCIIRDSLEALRNCVERCLFLFLVPAGWGWPWDPGHGEIQAGKKGSCN